MTPYTRDNTKDVEMMGCRVEAVVTIATASELPAELRFGSVTFSVFILKHLRLHASNTHARRGARTERSVHGEECARRRVCTRLDNIITSAQKEK